MGGTYTLPAGTGLYHLPLDFSLQHGGVLSGGCLAHRCIGNPEGPVVAVLGGISAGRDVRSWWGALVGPP